MKKFLRENKFIVLIFTMLFGVLIYSALQTLITSDDLPYSLFYRGEYRITHLSQIIANQESDYLTINGRFLVHCVVQFMLMFGKNLFAVVNLFFRRKLLVTRWTKTLIDVIDTVSGH